MAAAGRPHRLHVARFEGTLDLLIEVITIRDDDDTRIGDVPIESKCAAEHHHSKGLAGALCMPDDAAFPGAICAKLFHPLDGCPDAEILRMARDLPDAAIKNSEAPHQVEQTLGTAQGIDSAVLRSDTPLTLRSEEHTSELQSLMRISY